MKKILIAILLVFALITFSFPGSALAAGNPAKGKIVFNAKCNVCHQGGKNRVIPVKNLSKSALEKFGMYSAAAIIKQVTYGKGAMPRFGSSLKTAQIEDVAAYVLEQADQGW
ncbi:c-type cytochrome [Moorena producens JHB]|uniref:C-type cytochrome n=1 Tax=Moorena producens (strain JHB) TaxID=1454205 RepID=A0A1D9G3J1_MOOP1|nr:c-type cytochrome [Moorena producens]AOY81970.1 c-type cytochrome [Moorena producens JHB]